MQCCTLVCTPGNGATNVVAGRGRKQLAQGFEKWRGWAVENARRMRGLRAIMAKMRSRDCAVAFAAWWHHWAEKQRLRQQYKLRPENVGCASKCSRCKQCRRYHAGLSPVWLMGNGFVVTDKIYL